MTFQVDHEGAKKAYDEMARWGELLAKGFAEGMADFDSGRYARRQRMYARWNRVKRPITRVKRSILNALAWMFGR